MNRRFLVWYWSGGGGGSQFAAHLTAKLAQRFGPDAVELSMRADDPTLARAHRLGVRVHAEDVVSNRKRPLASMASLAASAGVLAERARGVDAVILPMNFAIAAPLACTLAKPLVYCAHDPTPHPGDYAALAQRLTQALLLRRAAHIVALSDFAAGALVQMYPGARAQLHTAPLASVFPPQPTSPPRAGATRLLFAGRMLAYKGLELLAGALDAIAHRDDWRLTIAGSGPALSEAVTRRFRHRQVERISAQWLDEAALERLIGAHDVLLAPYLSATQSGVVAQALARGKPCVATPVGALPEQIGAAGWIAAAATPEAFAAALNAMLDDPAARAEKSKAASAQARAAYESDAWGWLGT
jgi:glycosyltransferase involved in cell wall biosynthesis